MREYKARDGGLWHIEYDPKPVPVRHWDWTASHDDYDGAPDSGDNRCVAAATREELIEAIEDIE